MGIKLLSCWLEVVVCVSKTSSGSAQNSGAMMRSGGVAADSPGSLVMADQVRYMVYRVTREDCSRPDRGCDSFYRQETGDGHVTCRRFRPHLHRLPTRRPLHLNVGQHGHHGDAEAEQHVDADEDLVLGAAVRVGVVNVEQDQRHQGQ